MPEISLLSSKDLIFKGFEEFREIGLIDKIPRMIGIQAEGASPVFRAFRDRREDVIPFENPETIATAIRIGNPVNAKKALRAVYRSGGLVEVVSDQEIISAQKVLAKNGIGVEPASAASLAGLIKLSRMGEIDRDTAVVCIATGNLLKDPETVIKVCGEPKMVEANVEKVMALLT